MNTLGFKIVLTSTLVALATSGALTLQDWQAANAATVRLKSSAFPDLPTTVRRYLKRRGCEFPQAFSDQTPHNIVKGRFTSAAQMDIAVLCSKAGVSNVLVFRDSAPSAVAELAHNVQTKASYKWWTRAAV
jgi:hypothetical protein